MPYARRLDDRAHSILFDGGSWPNGRRIAARIYALAAVPAGLIPGAYLLNDSGADRSAVLVLSVVVLAGLTLTNVGGLSGTAKYGPLAGAVGHCRRRHLRDLRVHSSRSPGKRRRSAARGPAPPVGAADSRGQCSTRSEVMIVGT